MASSTQAAINSSVNTTISTKINKSSAHVEQDCRGVTQVQKPRSNYKNDRRQSIDCLQNQLSAYQTASLTPLQQYYAYKAQAWLNYATHENSIKSNSLAGTQALQAGTTILTALQQADENQLSLLTDIPSTSALMRPDLWATINALKDSGGIESAPRELAFSEVSLIWAAADHCAHGSRQSGSHFRMADRWLEQAREAYVNAHDSTTNVALEALINRYYKQYALLDSDDICRGHRFLSSNQELTNNKVLNSTKVSSIPLNRQVTFEEVISTPNPTATYSIAN